MSRFSASQLQAMQRWKAEVKAFVASVSGPLTAEERQHIDELIEANEAPIALSGLAWALEKHLKQVPPDVAKRLLELSGGMEPIDAFPPSVRETVDPDD